MDELIKQAAEAVNAASSFMLPELTLSFYSEKEPVLLSAPKRIQVDDCRVQDGCLQITSGGRLLIVAINPDEQTEEGLMNSSVSALSVTVEPEKSLPEQVVDGFVNKGWLYNQYAHKVFGQFLSAADKLPVTVRGEHRHVTGCPVESRVYQGKAYANLVHDCYGCMFCVDASESDVVYCTGRQRIATLEDFKRSLEERKNLYDEFLQPEKIKTVKAGFCPHCGGRLEERSGENGNFLGCSHYPFCHFTAEKKDGVIWFNF